MLASYIATQNQEVSEEEKKEVERSGSEVANLPDEFKPLFADSCVVSTLSGYLRNDSGMSSLKIPNL